MEREMQVDDESDKSNAKSSQRITELEEDGKQQTCEDVEGTKRREDEKMYWNKTSGSKGLAV